MNIMIIRAISAALLMTAVAACSKPLPPATAPSTNVNPITGSRGGGGATN